jgi:predicted unusual protein kinase regulating ubiquinone biosynthesis (AarF/ABC1/UbiB family)
MKIVKEEFEDLQPRMKVTKKTWVDQFKRRKGAAVSKLEKLVASDPILSLFEFDNDNKAVASASIGQVYKAKIRRGPQLEAAIGKENAAKWGGKTVAIKVQRPDVTTSASLDMYLLRRTAMWLSKMRGGGLPAIADQ